MYNEYMSFYRKYCFEIWAIAISILVNLLVFLPHLVGLISQDNEHVFTHVVAGFYQDEFSYFAWIKQAVDGSYLFQILFTTEAHSAYVFHPVFLLLGIAQKVTTIPLAVLWYIARILSNLFLLYTLYVLIKHFITSMPTRIIAFTIIVVGGGLGWLFGYLSADILYTETTVFQSLRWPIIFSLSLALLILVFIHIVRFYENFKWTDSLIAGLLGAILVLIHPYDIFSYYLIPIVYLIALVATKRLQINKIKFLKSVPWIFLPLIPAMYYLLLSGSSFVYNHNSEILMLSGSPVEYVLGFGLILLLGLLGIFYPRGEFENKKIFLIAWIVIGFLLLYVPIPFQRRLVMGLIIPLGMLSAIFLHWLWDKIMLLREVRISGFIKFFSTVCLLFIISGTNLLVIKEDFRNVESKEFPFYVDRATYNSLKWFDTNVENDKVILSSYELGNIIPGYTGNTVYVGHWAQTIDGVEKVEKVSKFFSGSMSAEEQLEFLKKSRINYVYYGEYERVYSGNDFMADQENTYESIYSNEEVKIYKVK